MFTIHDPGFLFLFLTEKTETDQVRLLFPVLDSVPVTPVQAYLPAALARVRPTNSPAFDVRSRARTASSDHFPGPLIRRKSTTMICAYSERISCSTAHTPIFGGAGGSGRGDVPR